MIIPLRASAVVFYRGWGTFAIVLANVAAYILTDPFAEPEVWLLQFGVFRPWQWVTSSFAHADPLHLIGNMLFLFWFGQIVEGRLGWLRFIPLYLLIAAAGGAIEQCVMLAAGPGVPGALGSSGAVFGLMTIALLWAPGARLTCLLVLWPFRVFEWPLVGVCGFYLLLNLLGAWLSGFGMSTPLLHLLGAVVGLAPALLLPRYALAYLGDWEGFFDPLRSFRRRGPNHVGADRGVAREREREVLRKHIEGLLGARDGAAAAALHQREVAAAGRWDLPAPLERQLIRGLMDQGRHETAVERVRRFLERRLPDSDSLRIAAAEVLLRHLRRPVEAIELLGAVDLQNLAPDLAARHARLVDFARRPAG
jgi:membrane associated rhomboid family serine protease